MDDPVVLFTEQYGPPWDCPFCLKSDINPMASICPDCGQDPDDFDLASVEAFAACVGKRIVHLALEEPPRVEGATWNNWNLNYWNGAETGVMFTFEDRSILFMYDDHQQCCERRWMHTDDDLSYFQGAILQGSEIRKGPVERVEYGDEKESQFLIVTTSKGQFTVVNYNEHNGYYGGFSLLMRRLTPQGYTYDSETNSTS